MKTLTITLHDTDNCGSSLQSYALQHFLLQNNIQNEIIDYIPEYVKNNGNPIRTLIRKIIFFKDSYVRDKKFKKFKREFLVVTKKKYKNITDLKNERFDCDCLITGSDQLWNSNYKCGQDPAFYLNFSDDIRKVAYAVSLGKEIIPADNLKILSDNCNNYKWVSVREKSSVEQIKDIFSNISVDHVCDPVLLNPASDYDKIKKNDLINCKYILVYMAQIPDTQYMNNIIKLLKKKYDVKVVLIGSYRNRCNSDIHIRNIDPGDFLSLIYNAEFIISNSFHATMFSLIYEKQFISILPDKNGARIKEILDKVNLKNNYINANEVINNIPYIDNYEKVRKELNKFRDYSRSRLIENLSGIDNE